MAPVAVSVDEPPLQITVGLAVVVRLNDETVNVTVLVFVQPTRLVPVTVYVVVTVGETTVVAPVIAPVFHVKVIAPPAVKVALFPAHIVVGLETAVTVGVGRTIRFNVLVLVQPEALVPVTV